MFMSNLDNQPYCKNRFSPMVFVGQMLVTDERVSKRYHTVKRGQSEVNFDFYSSPSRNARYVTEPGLIRIGSLTAKLTRPSEAEQPIDVHLYFGQSEIRVEAFDATGAQADCVLKLEW